MKCRAEIGIFLAAMFAAAFTSLSLSSSPQAQGQAIPEDEIRWGSQPFTPLLPGAVRVQTNMVEVGVVVRDNKGQAVPGLVKGDFEIFDQGKKMPLSFFSVETSARIAPPVATMPVPTNPSAPPPAPPPTPRTRYVAFYFDDNNLPVADLVFARKATEKFVNENLEPTDKVGIFTSSTTVTLDFTNDKPKLIAALAKLQTHQRRANALGSCPRMEPYQAYLIYNRIDPQAHDLAFAQAVQCNCPPDPRTGRPDPNCLAQQESMVQNLASMIVSIADGYAEDTLGVLNDVVRYLEKKDGRRMLVMASSGYFARSTSVQRAQDKVVDTALHAGVVINSIDAKGLSVDVLGGNPAEGPPIILAGGSVGNRPDLDAYADILANDTREVSNDPLAFLAEGTGGKFFHNNNDLARGVREIVAVPDVSYVLGFSPDALKSDGNYHTLKVRLADQRGLTISARPGYFAPSKSKSAPAEKYARLNRAVLAEDSSAEIPAEVTAQQGTLGSGETAVRVTVHVNVQGLPFKKQNGRHEERLIFITALFDTQGKFLTGAEGVMDFALRDASLPEVFSQGVTAKLSLQAPPGNYRLREVVQEVAIGKITSMSRAVEIR